MKKILFLVSLFFISIWTFAQPGGQELDLNMNPNAPQIKFAKTTHDFGTIPNGGNGNYEFKFTNTGKQPLILSNVSSTCGCTIPEWPKNPIMPGKSETIKVTYDTKKTGAFNKQITVTSNAQTSSIVLTISGNVSPK